MFHIIDDNGFIREIMFEILKDFGHQAIAFACPKAYIEFVKQSDYKKPVAIFTDVSMPLMNGYEMINIVSGLAAGSRFIVMTGESGFHSEYIDKSCMYLAKPFSPGTFKEVVDTLIACHRSIPSSHHRCSTVDDRKEFPLTDWSCPNICTECS